MTDSTSDPGRGGEPGEAAVASDGTSDGGPAPDGERPSGRNRLAGTNSPYLLQHADNPVDWHPWGEEAFRKAREEDKPVFLSIGYSTCHWCHVMEEESFEDEEVARLLNEVAVPVKVDREERPDVDGLYMSVCQAMTGSGGWPLNLFLTPDKKPFFAGTYIPKRSRGGRLGMDQLLPRIAEVWTERRDRVEETGDRVLGAVRQQEGAPGDLLDRELLELAYGQISDRYDASQGGFGSAPKFPSPHNLLFLLRHAHRTGEDRALEMAAHTLRRMRRGGIFDQVGYGFHRYSTDARWLLPHFEKMLYDQALLALAYVEAGLAADEPEFLDTAREVFRYVLRDLRSPEGGFHSAEDADSEGGEGAFYVWSEEELKEVLGEEDFRVAKAAWGVRSAGNYTEEATGERTGKNVLHRPRPLAEVAGEQGVPEGELRERLEGARRDLLRARGERPRPGLDDKVLTDWNGLMIAALARGSAALEAGAAGAGELLAAAREAAEFLLGAMRDDAGRLLHRYRNGEAGVPATADDYAGLTLGLVELYEATGEVGWLREAVRLQEEFADRCWDPDEGGFFLAGRDARELPVSRKEAYDGALPSSNSLALWNLRRLARLTGRPELEERADGVEAAFSGQVSRAPAAHTAMLLGLDFRAGTGHEVVVAAAGDGERPDAAAEEMLRILRGGFRPRTVHLLRTGANAKELAEVAPFTREQEPVDGHPAAYVCRDFACEAPTTDPEEMRALLDG